MFFKLTARNAYRDLVRNARRITIADISENEKSEAFQELWQLLHQKLGETERSLNAQPAYAKRCEHWNELEVVRSIKPVKNQRNPWLRFKREFEQALSTAPIEHAKRVSCALAWFYHTPHRDDWIV
jgi:hypothetical protein